MKEQNGRVLNSKIGLMIAFFYRLPFVYLST